MFYVLQVIIIGFLVSFVIVCWLDVLLDKLADFTLSRQHNLAVGTYIFQQVNESIIQGVGNDELFCVLNLYGEYLVVGKKFQG